MSIGARVYLVPTVCFLIALILAGVGLSRLIAIGDKLQTIVHDDLPLSHQLHEAIVTRTLQTKHLERAIELNGFQDALHADMARAEEKRFYLLQGRLRATLTQLERRLRSSPDHDHMTGESEIYADILSLLETLDLQHGAYLNRAEEMLLQVKDDISDEPAALLAELRSIEAPIDKTQRQLMDTAEQLAINQAKSALRLEQSGIRHTATVFIVGLLITVALGVFLSRGINRPLAKLTSSMELLATGNLNIPTDLGVRTGEFGAMSRALDVFRKQIAGRAAAEMRSRQFLESAPDAMVVVNQDGEIVLVNAQVERLFGYPREELLGEKVEMLVPERYRKDHPENRARFHTDPKARPVGKGVDLHGVTKFGQEIPIELSLSPIETEDGLLVTGAIRDISERKREQEELSRSKQELQDRVDELERLQQELKKKKTESVTMADALSEAEAQLSEAVESISEGFALWGTDDRLIMCNRRYRGMYPSLMDVIQPGVTYENFLRAGYERGVFRAGERNHEELVREQVERHHRSVGVFEQELCDERWVRVSKRKTKSGRIVGILTDVSDRKSSEATIQRMALEDALTGLPNRTSFRDRLSDALANAARTGRLVGVMMLDLDHFKNVNDTLGHQAGDSLLSQVAERLTACVRNTDTVARLGGDEFAVIVTNTTEPDGITVLAERITESIGEPFHVVGNEVRTGTSIGITIYPNDPGDPNQLLRNADLALYRAKAEGRGTFQLYDQDMHTQVQARQQMEADLRLAMERGEFHLVYQPQLDIQSGRIVGVEALIRWTHPERGPISPGEFIPVAEASRLIIPISDWVLLTACRQMTEWSRAGMADVCVSVNISPLHFRQQNLIDQVRAALKMADLPPDLLELEITEGMAMDERVDCIGILNGLKDLGINLAIDDFGTGYSSLNRLKEFPVDRLKIDQSFVRDIASDWDDAAINSAVIRIGHSLNIKVIAEGVETLEQLEFLVEQGCDEIQGYYLSRPLPAEELAAFVQNHDPQRLRSVIAKRSAGPSVADISTTPKRARAKQA